MLTSMQADPVSDRGPMTAVRDPAPIYLDGVLCCFHSVAEPYAIRPDHFVTSGDAWADIYQLVPMGLTAAPVLVSSVAESTRS